MDTLTKIAYFAGIIDGEGTILIAKQTWKEKTSYFPRMDVSNSDRRIIEWIQSEFGGTIQKYQRQIHRRHKPVYRVSFHSSIAESVVRLILPFLIIKREQAEVFLAFRQRMNDKHPMHPLSADERATREQLYWAMKKLNKRGIGQAERLSEETPRSAGMQQSDLPGIETGRDRQK